jgi:hypothetical protein
MTRTKTDNGAKSAVPPAPEPRLADLTNLGDVQALINQLENERRQAEAQANLAAGQLLILYELRKQFTDE